MATEPSKRSMGVTKPEGVSVVVETTLATGWHGGPGVMLFPLLPLFWIALLVGAWFLFRRHDERGRTHSAEEILSERYARGEITVEEYRQRRGELRGGR
jgi:putative membrane protein